MKLLVGGSKSKLFHLQEFSRAISKYDIECKVVHDREIYAGFPSKKVSDWFQTRKKFDELISDFKPDLVLIDNPSSHFGLATLKAKIPLVVHLRGDYWSELKWAKETTYKTPHRRIALWYKNKIGKECLEKSIAILPLSNNLKKIVRKQFPKKILETMYQGINPSLWYPTEQMKIQHPSVGLLQDAIIWGKTKEMFILTEILEKMPEITFYWAGDGPFRDEVLTRLNKYENFHWLGRLSHPKQVREFLMSVDIYALISGFDTLGMTSQEAALMKKPVLATKIGGIPESMQENETGYLIEKGNFEQWIEKISFLSKNKEKAKQMGEKGRGFVESKFTWDVVAKETAANLKKILENQS
ncbi:glycosyl transferase family 1 [Nitrosopumilus cobalaminigenes]|uniref:Glycosyl transferase family 1 n=1 Tax=Nitrosopumilus cobalaminigenes TaxID=1470066 RepID=A0A7D5QZW3_9ARCH|nr:glycosyltransferase family 4 protein [Nitrosopumilus cobalaminigenes]QLH02197.1 glycosyl transferase family 1 [Nitrosopumilus cobalaminigenes]